MDTKEKLLSELKNYDDSDMIIRQVYDFLTFLQHKSKSPETAHKDYPLRGKATRYDLPFESVIGNHFY